MTRPWQEKPATGRLLVAAALVFTACGDEHLGLPDAIQPDAATAAMAAAPPGNPGKGNPGKWKDFEVLQTNAGPPPPFETRLRGNTRHDLGVQVQGSLDGDIVGTFTATITAHLHRHPQNHDIFVGPAKLDGTWAVTTLFGEPVAGTFMVNGHGYRELPGPFTGHLTARGTGDLAGMTLQATFQNGPAPGTFVIRGRILDP